MSVNVNSSVLDTYYRYKMPKILAKVEGKGNGIKTVIVNMVDVAKALSRPATYPTKFFGCELGAQTQFDFKNDRYIVNGSHESSKLQSLLDIFIRKYVLCPGCENPETDLYPNEKKGIIKQTCKACGNQSFLDMRHKLTTFILKNPPGMKPNKQGTSLTRKKNRKKEAEKNGRTSLQPGSPSIPEHSDNSDNSLNGELDDEDDGEWTVCVSQEAVKERMNDLTSGVKGLTLHTDLEKPQSERLEIFYEYCKNKKDSGILKPSAEIAVCKEIAGEADRLDIKENKAVMVLVELLLDENAVKLIPQYRVLFLLFTHGNDKSQKYLLGAIEKLVELKKDLLIKVPSICKVLYDSDIIEEEVFLDWGKKASKKYVSKETAASIQAKAQPFLKWLEEADVETSDEEDDIEIQYDDRAFSQTLKAQEKFEAERAVRVTVAAPPDEHIDDGDDSDVDIDNI